MQIVSKARAALFGACLITAGSAAYGQAVYGSLYGTVTDASGAVIPNATVVVTDDTKGTSVSVQANSTGNYTVEHLIPDSYTIKISAPGFNSSETKGIQISADTSPKVDASLAVGDSGQTVSVQADALPLLKTDRADVATVFDAKNTEDLPLQGRNFTGLQLLLPGAQALGFSHAASENPQGSQQIIINGQSFAGVGYELDGTDNQDPILGIIVINPTLESIEEAKITSQNYDAQFGKAVAAVITTQTKSGTNAFHGQVYDFRQSDAFQAKNPFNSSDPVTHRIVPAGLRNQFGGLIGGPILKDKAFFFFDYEGVRQKVGTSVGVLTVPTNVLRTSCAGAVGCDFSEYVGFTKSINDPLTGQPFAGNIIPKARLNPQAIALLERLPAPIITNATSPINNFPSSGTGVFNFNQYTTRLDYQVSQKVHAFGRYSYYKDTLSGATSFGALGGPGFGINGFGGTSIGHNQSLAVGADIVVTPKWLTDARFGFFRYNISTTKYDGSEPFATNAGLPGLNVTNFANTGGAPEFDFTDLPNNAIGNPNGNFGSGLNVNKCNCPLGENERQFQVVNNWTHELGNHSIKFGADVRHAYNLRVPSDSNRTGIMQFQAKNTSASDGSGGLGYASFVLGQVGTFNRYASNSSNASETQNRLFLYAQDTWRYNPKLTLNYGLRWENYFPEKVATNQGALYNLRTGNLQVAGQGPYGANMGVGNANKALAPRIGIAYQYDEKTVIRAGYGRSFDIGVFGSVFGHSVTQNLPVLAKQNVTSSQYNTAFILGGTPPAPNFGTAPVNGNIPLPDQVAANSRPTTERFPTLDAWNVAVERDLGHQFAVTAAYVANKGTHTFAGDTPATNPNQVALVRNGLAFNPAPAGVFQASPQTNCIGAPNPGLPCSASGDPRRRPYYGAFAGRNLTQDINYFGNDADTHFNALQVTLDKRFSNGYQFKVNYSYQVATNYNNDYFQIDKRVEHGNADFLRHNQITFFGNLELPFGHNHYFLNNGSGLVDRVVNGWELSPTVNVASGLPFWPSFVNCGADRDTGPCTPNYSGSGFNTGLGSFDPVNKFNTFFRKQAPILPGSTGPFTDPGYLKFGNVQRNSFFGPGLYNFDLSAQKTVDVYERASVVFRTDFFNILNHQNFGNPDVSLDSATAGRINQLAIGDTPRYIQFAVRVKF